MSSPQDLPFPPKAEALAPPEPTHPSGKRPLRLRLKLSHTETAHRPTETARTCYLSYPVRILVEGEFNYGHVHAYDPNNETYGIWWENEEYVWVSESQMLQYLGEAAG